MKRLENRQMSILLVEDHEDTRNVMKRLLGLMNYQIEVAASIKEALAMSNDKQYDIMLSDVGLPDGVGYELLNKMKNKPRRSFALTGREDEGEAQAHGFDGHLVKPIGMGQLQSVLDNAATIRPR